MKHHLIPGLEKKFSTVAGVPVEITHTGGQSFTFATEERNEKAAEKIRAFLIAGGATKINIEHDDECGSFVYVDL